MKREGRGSGGEGSGVNRGRRGCAVNKDEQRIQVTQVNKQEKKQGSMWARMSDEIQSCEMRNNSSSLKLEFYFSRFGDYSYQLKSNHSLTLIPEIRGAAKVSLQITNFFTTLKSPNYFLKQLVSKMSEDEYQADRFKYFHLS